MIKKIIILLILGICFIEPCSAKDYPRYGVVFFTSQSCVYCVKMKKEVWNNTEIKDKMKSYGWHEVNYDDNKELVKDFKVEAMPTTFLVKYRSLLIKHDNIRYEQCIIIRSKVGYMNVRETKKFLTVDNK